MSLLLPVAVFLIEICAPGITVDARGVRELNILIGPVSSAFPRSILKSRLIILHHSPRAMARTQNNRVPTACLLATSAPNCKMKLADPHQHSCCPRMVAQTAAAPCYRCHVVVCQNARRDSESELELFRAGNQQQRKGPGRAPCASVEANSRTWPEISRWKVFVSLFSTQLGRSGSAGRPALRAR